MAGVCNRARWTGAATGERGRPQLPPEPLQLLQVLLALPGRLLLPLGLCHGAAEEGACRTRAWGAEAPCLLLATHTPVTHTTTIHLLLLLLLWQLLQVSWEQASR